MCVSPYPTLTLYPGLSLILSRSSLSASLSISPAVYLTLTPCLSPHLTPTDCPSRCLGTTLCLAQYLTLGLHVFDSHPLPLTVSDARSLPLSASDSDSQSRYLSYLRAQHGFTSLCACSICLCARSICLCSLWAVVCTVALRKTPSHRADACRDLRSTIWNRNLTGTSGNSSLIRFRSHLWQKHWSKARTVKIAKSDRRCG